MSTLLRRASLPSCGRVLGMRSGISESVVDADVYAEIGRRSPRTGLGIWIASLAAVVVIVVELVSTRFSDADVDEGAGEGNGGGSFGGFSGGVGSREGRTSAGGRLAFDFDGFRRSGSRRGRGGAGSGGRTLEGSITLEGGRRFGCSGGRGACSAVLTRWMLTSLMRAVCVMLVKGGSGVLASVLASALASFQESTSHWRSFAFAGVASPRRRIRVTRLLQKAFMSWRCRSTATSTNKRVTPATMATMAPGLGSEVDARRTSVNVVVGEGVDLTTSGMRAEGSERGGTGSGVEVVVGGNEGPSCGGVSCVGAPDSEDACTWGTGTGSPESQVGGSTRLAFTSAGNAL